jgi:hypothetical protein
VFLAARGGQHAQEKHQEQLRAACAAKGGKLALSNLCTNMKPILDELHRQSVDAGRK